MTNESDGNFQIEVQRLHKLTVYARWLTVIFLWISVGSLSIWGLRDEIALWLEHFTWAAVRYGLSFHRWPQCSLGKVAIWCEDCPCGKNRVWNNKCAAFANRGRVILCGSGFAKVRSSDGLYSSVVDALPPKKPGFLRPCAGCNQI